MIYGAIWQGCVASCAEARRALKHTHTCGQHTRKSFKLKARTRYPPPSLALCVAVPLCRSFVIWLHPHKAFILCADACVVPQTGDANKMKLQGGTQTHSLCMCVCVWNYKNKCHSRLQLTANQRQCHIWPAGQAQHLPRQDASPNENVAVAPWHAACLAKASPTVAASCNLLLLLLLLLHSSSAAAPHQRHKQAAAAAASASATCHNSISKCISCPNHTFFWLADSH